MGNNGKDTSKMGVRSKEKNHFFSENVISVKQKDRQTSFKDNAFKIHHTAVILKQSKCRLKG